MFDNPKKELERLQAQLQAAERSKKAHMDETANEEFDILYDEIYEEFGREEPYKMDDELESMLRHRDIMRRSAGFEEDEVMDEDRYVPAVKEKSLRGLVIFGLVQAIVVIAVAIWWIGRLS